MASKAHPSSKIVVVVIVGFALLIVAIIARNFWLSLFAGIAGIGTMAYLVFLLRKYRNTLPHEGKNGP